MKQALTLIIFCAFAAVAHAGPEAFSGKDDLKQVVEPIAPVEAWFADNEWNVSIWGTYAFAGNEIEKEEEPDIPWESDRYLGADDAWGGGVDLKYFFHRYFGLGIQGYALAVHRDAPDLDGIIFGENGNVVTPHDDSRIVGSVLGTFTLRYPVGRFAPYIFSGIGVTFGGGDVENFEFEGRGNGHDYFEIYRSGDDSALLGQFGGGLEVRVTRRIGVMADCNWNVVNGPRNNFGMVRSGVIFAF